MSSSNISPILHPYGPAVTGGLYLLQVNNASAESTECVPLHLLVNNLNNKNEHRLVPLLEINPEDSRTLLQLQQGGDSTEVVEPLNYCVYKHGSQTTIITHSENKSMKTNTVNNLVATNKSSGRGKRKEKCKYNSVKETKSCQVQQETGIKLQESQKIQNFVHMSDRAVPPRAVAALPAALQLRRGCVSPRRSLPARVRFGPLQGVERIISVAEADVFIINAATSSTPIFFRERNEVSVLHVDVSDQDRSNWLSLLPLGDQTTANVWLYEEDDEIYGVTTKPIASRKLLALGYSKRYAESHQLPPGLPVLNIHEGTPDGSKKWWCSECQHGMGSYAILQRHKEMYHEGDQLPPRRRYRCTQCTRTFSRLSALKRHMLGFCKKKPEKPPNEINKEPIEREQNVLYTGQNAEDTRAPSDESLQNYTNVLDFSTNLFDTDRIPNLDISGSSRSSEFNPYAVGIKEENCFESDVRLTKSSGKNGTKNDWKVLVVCPHCDDIVVKEKRRLHLRECPARHFECECGRVFNKKDHLAQHIHTEHSVQIQTNALKDKINKQLSESQYKCEKCKHEFKRRGMLVNHLWRVHNLSTSVPLERRVRHYPCAACPKIYRAAAKRDRHVRNHHPGSELVRAAPIEGERRACAAAACAAPACPRQYATRAKMLQHMRAHHPQLAEAMKTKPQIKETCKKDKEITESTPSQLQSLEFY